MTAASWTLLINPGRRAPTPIAAPGPRSTPPSRPTRSANRAASATGPRRSCAGPSTKRSTPPSRYPSDRSCRRSASTRSSGAGVTLEPPCRHERRQLAQPVGSSPERSQRVIRGFAELRGELPRTVDAAERDERRLARVGAERLAGLCRIAGDVEQVVDDLEGE